MSTPINSVGATKPCISFKKSEYQCKGKNTKGKRRRQFITEREGAYYCTYIVNREGQKILISRAPIDQAEEQKGEGKSTDPSGKSPYDYNAVKNARTAFECKQEMGAEVTHKKNLKEIMDILDDCVGIPTDSSKTYGY